MSDRKFYTYAVSDQQGVVRYVGASSGEKRWSSHEKFSSNKQLRALSASGEVFKAVKVREGLTQQEALEHELALIAQHGRQCDGGTLFNKAAGRGTRGIDRPPEYRARLIAGVRRHLETDALWRASKKLDDGSPSLGGGPGVRLRKAER